ncbi:MAG: branched-chain amino acid ABC transporter permease [Candidatus Krumholzibacteria bacterium]
MGVAAKVGIGCAGVLALVLPQFLNTFWISLLIQILVFGLLALSADLLIGHTGLFPLGHAALLAVAAYTTAILEVRHAIPTLLAAPAGVAVAVFFSLIFGVAVRTSGVYFILVTLAFGHIVWGVLLRWSSFTGGDNGVGNVPAPTFGPISFPTLSSYYYLALAVVVVCTAAYRVLVRSPFGLTLRGIRESESRMRALGYNVVAHKYAAFVVSGLFAGIAGVLYIYWNRFVSPATTTLVISAEATLMAIIGGTGTIFGPFIGSAIILVIRNYVSGFLVQWMTVMGLVFIATVLWAPDGLLGLARRYRARRARDATSPDMASLPKR